MTSVDGKLIEIASFPIECLRSDQRVGETVRLNLEVGLGRVEQPIVEARRRRRAVDHVDEGDETAGRFTFGDLHGRVMRRLMEELRIANIERDRVDSGNETQKEYGCQLHLEWRATTMFVCDTRERREEKRNCTRFFFLLSLSFNHRFFRTEREKNGETNNRRRRRVDRTFSYVVILSTLH